MRRQHTHTHMLRFFCFFFFLKSNFYWSCLRLVLADSIFFPMFKICVSWFVFIAVWTCVCASHTDNVFTSRISCVKKTYILVFFSVRFFGWLHAKAVSQHWEYKLISCLVIQSPDDNFVDWEVKHIKDFDTHLESDFVCVASSRKLNARRLAQFDQSQIGTSDNSLSRRHHFLSSKCLTKLDIRE